MSERDPAKDLIRALVRSQVIGFNDDGSVWVFGGLAAEGSLTYTHGGKTALAPVWKKGETFATADSPLAAALREVIPDVVSRSDG